MPVIEGEDDDFVPSLGVSIPKSKDLPGEAEESTKGKRNFSTRDKNSIPPPGSDKNMYNPAEGKRPVPEETEADAAARRRYAKMA